MPLPYSPFSVNAYLIRGERGRLLVDTGLNIPEMLKTLTRQLGEKKIKFKNITQVVVTHFHPDHIGLAERIKQLSGLSFRFTR